MKANVPPASKTCSTGYEYSALEMDDGLMTLVSQSSAWIVHSVFRQTINLISDHEDLITITTHKSSLMPYSLVTSADCFEHYKDKIHQTALVSEHEIMISHDLRFKLNGEIKSSKLPVLKMEIINQEQLLSNIERLQTFFSKSYTLGSFYIDSLASPYNLALQQTLIERTRAFCEAVKNQNDKAALDAGTLLLGLGAGLTPSGDDYLVGFFAVLFFCSYRSKAIQQLAHDLAQNARESTNIISATYIKSASEKRFKKEISNLVQSVYQTDENLIAQSLSQLLEVGSTSGTDITQGILDAFFILTSGENNNEIQYE